MNFNINEVVFDEKGLIPAIVQDCDTKDVLMLGYMNMEALELTLKEDTVWFYSRSRQELWNKGATSGNYLKKVSLALDCDNDTILVTAKPLGPVCHTGSRTCFTNKSVADVCQSIFPNALYEIVSDRKVNPVEGSYTNYLFDKGIDKILKKVGEESAEVIIASKNTDDEDLIGEIGDLLYHLTVLMVEKGIDYAMVDKLLKKRHSK